MIHVGAERRRPHELLEDDRLSTLQKGDVWTKSGEALCALLIEKGHALEPHLEHWVQDFVNSGSHALVEGEGIQPAWTAALSKKMPVHAVFVVELNPERIRATLEHRSSSFRRLPEDVRRRVIAMNVLYNRWIKREAQKHSERWLESRPWNTLPDRILVAFGT